MDSLKDLIVKYLRDVADKMEVGTSEALTP